MAFIKYNSPVGRLIPPAVYNLHRILKTRRLEKKYRGNDVYCPICESEYSSFGSHGRVTRHNVKCHRCGSLERHRALWLFLVEKRWLEPGKKGIRLLHVAPERSFFLQLRKKRGIDYHACDLDPGFYAARGMHGLIEVNITKMPFEDNVFDLILCNHVLEHIPEDRLAMSELFRVLRPGGKAVCQVPMKMHLKKTYENPAIIGPKERLKHFGQEDHVRWYGQDYGDRLRSVGFTVIPDPYLQSLSPSDKSKYRINTDKPIYSCFKS